MSYSPTNIADFIHVLSDMPKTDMLVNLSESVESLIRFEELPTEKFQVQLEGKWKSVWQVANRFRLESDVNSLCLVFGTVTSTIQTGTIQSPLLIVPLNWEYTRINNTLQLEMDEEAIEMNPYIKFLYSELNNESLSSIPDNLNLPEKLEWVIQQFQNVSLDTQFSREIYGGNFHYHRFHILRELEGIEKSGHKNPLVQQLLGNDFEPTKELNLSPDLIYPADVDQKQVFNTLNSKNVLLQGPPGTGKSQVLINILGKSLKSELKTLVVSEKRVALDVLVKKLSELQLDPFAFVVHSQTKSKDLLAQLKATWNVLESSNLHLNQNLRLSEQLYANLQLLFDRLNTSDYFAGVSYGKLQDLLLETPITNQLFSSSIPTIDEWLESKPVIQKLDLKLNGFSKLKGLKPAFFEQWNGDQLIKNAQGNLQIIQSKLSELVSFGDLEQLISVLGRCQLVENEQYRAYSLLLSKPKEWKKFKKQVLLFKELKERFVSVEKENQIWKQVPSKSQLESWEQASTWIQLRKRKKAITRLLNDSSVLPEIALANWKNYLSETHKLKELESYFAELGLEATAHALDMGMIYATSLENESGSLLSEISGWTKEKRVSIISCGSELNQLRSALTRSFELNDEVVLADFLIQKQAEFIELSAAYEDLRQLPRFFFGLLDGINSWEEMQSLILFSSLRKIESVNPEIVKFSGESLQQRLDQIIETENREFSDFGTALRVQIQKHFSEFEELLRIPSQKLSPPQKELKARLKKGKSLLVKEFGKSRNHITIRNLIASDAKEWVQLLIPIWLATPNQVADHFPLEMELFDLVLFDEASQLPLPNALGSLFRSKRALVAGDEQQMAPSNYFGKNFGFHDLLHQAAYYFERVPLRHHYRSEYRELIQFSNTHFYKDELIVYPSPDRKEVLFHHLVENGIFDQRRNQLEAKSVADFLESFTDWETKTLGIVAFSEEQLKTIWLSCSPRVQNLIALKEDENKGFFKALENVQGDEADVLIISLAYARNPEGSFQMRFGPLNQTNGHKRLNVLLTRAKQEMHFFSSVRSTDFELSDNESVNLLRRFLQELEIVQTSEKAVVFPYGLEGTIENKAIRFKNAYAQVPNGQDLVTLHRVMKQRGWKLDY
ncbi:ATP-binding protein [Fluviicola taffensis]|uniref:DEAD/DEAH box helicase n=1 Tax=Fluviicola taffensis TaxID=191579 RepID=UPI003137B53F